MTETIKPPDQIGYITTTKLPDLIKDYPPLVKPIPPMPAITPDKPTAPVQPQPTVPEPEKS